MRRYPKASLSLPSHGGVLMLLPALLSLVSLQPPTAPAPSPPIAKVEVKPSGGEVPIGGKLQFTARALDSVGAEVPRAEIGWFVGGDVGGVDSLGVFTGGYQGFARVTAVGFLRGVSNSQVVGVALVHVLPEPPARIVLDPRAARLGPRSPPRLSVVKESR